jgi:hypothetical protein
MLKYLFFKLVDLYTYYKPKYENFKIQKKYKYIDGVSQIHYTYNDKSYVYIGDDSKFPPTFVPKFSVPIKSAESDGVDVTSWVKMCAGPKVDLPDPKYIMATTSWRLILEYGKRISLRYEVLLIPDDDAVLEVENALSQKRVLGKTSLHRD